MADVRGIRTRWLCGLLVSVLALTLTGLVQAPNRPAAGAASTRPNVIFIMADDLSTNLVKFMPNVRRLAADGVSLRRYYVVDSLCCPSRTSIMTGDYPHNTGVFTNTAPDGGYDAFLANGDQNKTFPIALQKAGYRTAIMGKFLNGYEPDDPPAPGWTDWVSTGTDGYSEFNYTLRVDSMLEPHGSAPADYLTDVLSDKATGFVQSAVAAKSPFFLEVASFAPHDPEVPAPRYASAYPGSVLPKTPAFNTLPSDPVAWMSTIQPMDATDLAFVQEKWLARVRSVLAIDDLLGRIRTQLATLGVAGNTYVVFSSDNGFHLGDHRLNYGKQTAFDTDIRVPLIVAGPGVPAGRSNNQMMSSIDLAPTFEDVAGASIPATVDGVSMLRQWYGLKPAGWQKAILIEHHLRTGGKTDPDAQQIDPPTYEAVRTATGLYVEYPLAGVAEYYDTATDPYELRNVPALAPAGVVARLHHLEACVGAAQCQSAAGAG